MSLTVAIQMDPIESIDIRADSTFVIGLELQRRGYRLWHYLPTRLSLRGRQVIAHGHPMTVQAVEGNHYRFGSPEMIDLATVDVVLMRQDPPFDMAYITATHILEHLPPQVLVVNDPMHVRNAPEKLLVMHYSEWMPPTMVTADRAEIEAFRREHGDIVIKPLFGAGGSGVFHLKPDDPNLGALLEMFHKTSRESLMVQRYLPEIRNGDKRIILIDGEPVGAVSRIPQEGESRANFHAGGQARKATLTAREQDICRALRPALKERGLLLAGIDVIGDFLTEINVTSPTGLQEINRFDGTRLEAQVVDAIEARRNRKV